MLLEYLLLFNEIEHKFYHKGLSRNGYGQFTLVYNTIKYHWARYKCYGKMDNSKKLDGLDNAELFALYIKTGQLSLLDMEIGDCLPYIHNNGLEYIPALRNPELLTEPHSQYLHSV